MVMKVLDTRLYWFMTLIMQFHARGMQGQWNWSTAAETYPWKLRRPSKGYVRNRTRGKHHAALDAIKYNINTKSVYRVAEVAEKNGGWKRVNSQQGEQFFHILLCLAHFRKHQATKDCHKYEKLISIFSVDKNFNKKTSFRHVRRTFIVGHPTMARIPSDVCSILHHHSLRKRTVETMRTITSYTKTRWLRATENIALSNAFPWSSVTKWQSVATFKFSPFLCFATMFKSTCYWYSVYASVKQIYTVNRVIVLYNIWASPTTSTRHNRKLYHH